ncbi:hypothetical protein C8A00DRAFT_14222 [Chaetomidium leptoderma]|uniref:Uncharacterized protein n=1 Tax=Chaetomidium leptoderma TaxID=669021 RepID=A0AAN6VN69_9PEZI|nr:hypothetical protein C8A00DRAFT_14222 [Chaetomidium leptoderma]
MCFHKRLVFACSHHAWLGVTQPCELEEAFNRREVNTGCSVMWSHGYDTIRIQAKCPKCAKTQAGHGFRFGIVKDRIKVLKEHLELIKGLAGKKDKVDSKQEQDQDVQSDDTNEGNATSSLPGGTKDTGDASFDDGCETMEEVRVDPKHWPLKLGRLVTGQLAS